MILRILLSIAAILSCIGIASAAEPATKKPNIIFILADDLGYGDLGCYGQKLIQTPNIDQLAKEGTRFTQCYAGSTVCAPSRCALMTGYHTGHGFVRGNLPGKDLALRAEDKTVAELLKKEGYTTGLIGKWGLGEENTAGAPHKKGFDYSYGYLNQNHAHNYWTDHLFRNGERVALPNVLEKKKVVKAVQYTHDLFAKEALDFIEKNKDKNFFLDLCFTIPHAKLEPPDDKPYSDKDWDPPSKNFASMITRMDTDIGKLMKKLKDLKLDENTIVFFSSDNGPHKEGGIQPKFFKSSGPLRGIKRDLYEGGIRVPMIARWPGKVAAEATSDQVMAFWDFLPTAVELAGAKPPAGIDGISMVPALLGEKAAGRKQDNHEFLYWEFHEKGFHQAVRMGDWKYVKQPVAEGKIGELFNLKDDVGETKNLADKYPEIVKKMEDYLKMARTESKEFVPKMNWKDEKTKK